MTLETLSQSKPAHIFGIERKKVITDLPETFPEVLRRTAELFPEKGIQMRDRAGRVSGRRSYPELLQAVKESAGRWRSLGVKSGDCILLCLPTAWDFIDAWLGAICIGAHPAAIASVMGGLSASSNFAERLEKYRSVIDAEWIIAGDRMVNDLRKDYGDTLGAISYSTADIESQEIGEERLHEAKPEELAFLQFTSGSTGMPRAVMISHRMATHNAFSINEGIGDRYGAPADEWAELHSAWLPMHHDMGLIGCLLLAIANGIELSLMNPTTFLARPIKYLESLSGKKAMMAGPNFGYQFCVDRIKKENLVGLDLSKVGVAMTGSEMIRPETMDAFCNLVECTGFTPDKIMPCYGMAEATLAVTFDSNGAGVRTHLTPQQSGYHLENQEVVCCGIAVPDTEVRIANDDGETLQEGDLGEILVKGPAVFSGYYKNAAETAASKHGEWLRTGDLGFTANGELYIAGRFKEILVIRGDNIMPHELEWLAEEARGQGTGGERIAAFSVHRPNIGEEIVLVVETNESDAETLKGLDRAIKTRIGRAMSLPVFDLAFVRRGAIPRTSSGKIQRGKIKEDYLNQKVERVEFE
ncbi:AMP-binding protein [Puniceicoccaceae bacterium K14]|nr:AMP-binding protein [Puniceicoccaceae bacterium K14]